MATLMEQHAAAQKAARDFITGLKAKGDDVTDEDLAEADTLAKTAADLAKKLDGKRALDDLSAGLTGADEAPAQKQAKSLGEHFIKTVGDQLAGKKGSKFTLSAPEFKAAGDVQTVGSVFGPAVTDVDRNIVTGVRRRLTVADLLGSETISGSAITYFVEGALEGDFTTVAENGQKPQLHFADPTAVTEALKKIAAFIKESDEIIEDLPWYKSAVDGRLLYHLGLFEENQLLSGSGAGTNIRGLLNRVGIQTEAAANRTDNADALFRAITKVVTGSGFDADGIVINPADYQTLRLSKDGNGQYFGGGFFSGQYGNGGIQEQPPLWGLRTVVTPAITAGTALVGAYAQSASVIRKGGVRVESTNTDEDDFTNNRVTIRAEERLALAARQPAGFVKVTFSSAAPA
ncbi:MULTISPECIES: phage major capsid protein [unclassified Rathayibacter]|uniref:phage major capsid protein n=1 Tax=unclassified Rathayibacter TaxID=2609250 RepID=UPI000CE8820F|nr:MULTISPECIES: phage major capsid protein [unclassified Rathayibacter]MCJ1687779.1 phage major capsid protein [Rathayibacter sp. VKM Ac-2927]PPH99725.1 phage major capsid protein [Rathayibacter sp. AY1B7]